MSTRDRSRGVQTDGLILPALQGCPGRYGVAPRNAATLAYLSSCTNASVSAFSKMYPPVPNPRFLSPFWKLPPPYAPLVPSHSI